MIKLGDIVICKDGHSFSVASMPDGEYVLIDLDTDTIRFTGEIVSYVNAYHLGIANIISKNKVVVDLIEQLDFTRDKLIDTLNEKHQLELLVSDLKRLVNSGKHS